MEIPDDQVSWDLGSGIWDPAKCFLGNNPPGSRPEKEALEERRLLLRLPVRVKQGIGGLRGANGPTFPPRTELTLVPAQTWLQM